MVVISWNISTPEVNWKTDYILQGLYGHEFIPQSAISICYLANVSGCLANVLRHLFRLVHHPRALQRSSSPENRRLARPRFRVSFSRRSSNHVGALYGLPSRRADLARAFFRAATNIEIVIRMENRRRSKLISSVSSTWRKPNGSLHGVNKCLLTAYVNVRASMRVYTRAHGECLRRRTCNMGGDVRTNCSSCSIRTREADS